jgi:hypothetical protein
MTRIIESATYAHTLRNDPTTLKKTGTFTTTGEFHPYFLVDIFVQVERCLFGWWTRLPSHRISNACAINSSHTRMVSFCVEKKMQTRMAQYNASRRLRRTRLRRTSFRQTRTMVRSKCRGRARQKIKDRPLRPRCPRSVSLC